MNKHTFAKMDGDFRMLANPYRLSKDYQKSEKVRSSFSEELRSLVEKEYEDVYISPQIHKDIIESVRAHLKTYIRTKVVSEVVDIAIEHSIKDVLDTEHSLF